MYIKNIHGERENETQIPNHFGRFKSSFLGIDKIQK